MPNPSNHSPHSSDNRHVRRPSRSQPDRELNASVQSASQPAARHRREKSNIQPPTAKRDSSANESIPQRPALKGRTQSAPMIPHHHNGTNGHEPGNTLHETRDESLSDESNSESGEDQDEIAHDPFFQRYSAPSSQGAPETTSPHLSQSSQDDEGLQSPARQARPRHIVPPPPYTADYIPSQSNPVSPAYQIPLQSPAMAIQQYQEINVAVVGSPRVGKSTFIQQAFDLGQMPLVHFTRRKMSLDGTIYVVRLIEFSYRDLDMDDDQCICWPDIIDGHPVPAIDGAFTLYDVTNKDSLIQLPETLRGIYHSGLPYLLVACKCDYSPNLRPIDTSKVDGPLQSMIGDIRTFQTSITSPDTQKRCMAVMLRQIIAKRTHQYNQGVTRRRAVSSANQNVTSVDSALRHNRANSDMSMHMYHGPSQRQRPDLNLPLTTRSRSHQQLNLLSPTNTVFETHSAHHSDDEDIGIGLRSPKTPGMEMAQSFTELVDRLLVYPATKADQRFASIFLALYRLFASPSQLLDHLIEKSKAISLENLPTLTMVQHRQHHLWILEQWIGHYPGDFAHAITKLKLSTFISKLGEDRHFTLGANQLATNLDFVSEDDDTDWAFCDKDGSMSNNDIRVPPPVSSTNSTPLSPTHPSMSSTQSLLSLVEHAAKQAANLVPNPRYPLTKVQWHLLMDTADDVVARELTRMDWTMFCAIRPRDLVRHVTLSDTQKAKCKSLENVTRMINHFNHIAAWVGNLILLRDKPKHRAFMLEKMMRVARELRRLNNYNALGAFIAGINSSPVVRLQMTKDMIDPAVGKDFLKLEILMSSQRSHAAYRLAWENTSGERIPYLPLHRRDLVAAAEGNRTFSDEVPRRINWRKFEIVGDVVVGLQRAREVPYPVAQISVDVRGLVVEVEIETDEDKLYERSQMVEPSSASNTARGRRFPWLQG